MPMNLDDNTCSQTTRLSDKTSEISFFYFMLYCLLLDGCTPRLDSTPKIVNKD